MHNRKLKCIYLLLLINMFVSGFRVVNIALRNSRLLPGSVVVRALFSSVPSKDLSIYGENTLVEKVYGSVSKNPISVPQFTKGQLTEVKILRLSSLGATVGLGNTNKKGIILANELDVYHEGKPVKDYLRIGDSIDGFVANIDENGRILVSLRPTVEKRITATRDMILNALQLSPSGELPIGDKSSPDEIAQFFHGVSKTDFKNAVGKLMKEKLVKPGAHAIALYSEEEIAEQQKAVKPYVEKPHFLRTDPELCVFFGNLPVSVDEATLASAVEQEIGLDTVEEVRLVRNSVTQVSRGFAFVQFKTGNAAKHCLRTLRGCTMFGRKIRMNKASRKITMIKVPSGTPHSTPLVELRSSSSALAVGRTDRDSSIVSGDEDAIVQDALNRRQIATKKGSATPSMSKDYHPQYQGEEDLEEGVDGILSPEEYSAYASLLDNDADFDPERDYYVVSSEEGEKERSSGRVTKIRTDRQLEGSDRYDDENDAEETEPEDYNDINLYKPQQKGEEPRKRRQESTRGRGGAVDGRRARVSRSHR